MTGHASHLFEPAGHIEPVAEGSSKSPPLIFTRQTVQAVDRAAIEEFGIPGVVLMENAARGLFEHALLMIDSAGDRSGLVLIMCGRGNNGGDGYALARHLHNRGVHVVIAPVGEPDPNCDAGINRAVCGKMGLGQIDIGKLDSLLDRAPIMLIVDAIFGTGLDRPVSGESAAVIDWVNHAKRPVLAVDVPSGMDCNSGEALGCAVKATRTVTFVGLKSGFLSLEAQKLLGEVAVCDIGAPIELLHRYGRSLEQLSHHEAPERQLVMTGPGRQPGR